MENIKNGDIVFGFETLDSSKNIIKIKKYKYDDTYEYHRNLKYSGILFKSIKELKEHIYKFHTKQFNQLKILFGTKRILWEPRCGELYRYQATTDIQKCKINQFDQIDISNIYCNNILSNATHNYLYLNFSNIDTVYNAFYKLNFIELKDVLSLKSGKIINKNINNEISVNYFYDSIKAENIIENKIYILSDMYDTILGAVKFMKYNTKTIYATYSSHHMYLSIIQNYIHEIVMSGNGQWYDDQHIKIFSKPIPNFGDTISTVCFRMNSDSMETLPLKLIVSSKKGINTNNDLFPLLYSGLYHYDNDNTSDEEFASNYIKNVNRMGLTVDYITL